MSYASVGACILLAARRHGESVGCSWVSVVSWNVATGRWPTSVLLLMQNITLWLF